jgi:hypothetical protein
MSCLHLVIRGAILKGQKGTVGRLIVVAKVYGFSEKDSGERFNA